MRKIMIVFVLGNLCNINFKMKLFIFVLKFVWGN